MIDADWYIKAFFFSFCRSALYNKPFVVTVAVNDSIGYPTQVSWFQTTKFLYSAFMYRKSLLSKNRNAKTYL